MYQAGYIERLGTGVSEMIRLSLEAGLREPEFDFSSGVAITLWRPLRDAGNDAGSDAGSDAGNDLTTTKKLHKKELEELILSVSKEGLSLEEIAQKVGKSKSHLRNRIIPELIREGRLKKMYPDNDPNQKFITVED
jgi:predicted HTH transcriptional regulator